ncbi:hypothetical protein IH779_02995 [Patescibacteria group bacterium]|nr:hypothetical protein [Patescibacteria group bacterium]
MKKYSFIFAGIFIVLGIFVFALISAQEELAGIIYPIPELDNCESQTACEAYCELPGNMSACLDFGEAHNLISQEELEIARRMLAAGETAGPGGCQGFTQCNAYCNDISHIEECLAFGEKHDLIPPEELEKAKKVAAAIKQGITPPNCNNKAECEIYCSQPEHMEECIIFAEAAGLIPPDELEEVKKYLAAIQRGLEPLPCWRKSRM